MAYLALSAGGRHLPRVLVHFNPFDVPLEHERAGRVVFAEHRYARREHEILVG